MEFLEQALSNHWKVRGHNLSPYFEKKSSVLLIKPAVYSISNILSSFSVHDDQDFRNSQAHESQRTTCAELKNKTPIKYFRNEKASSENYSWHIKTDMFHIVKYTMTNAESCVTNSQTLSSNSLCYINKQATNQSHLELEAPEWDFRINHRGNCCYIRCYIIYFHIPVASRWNRAVVYTIMVRSKNMFQNTAFVCF